MTRVRMLLVNTQKRRIWRYLPLLALLLFALAPADLYAHAFGQRYTLPLPLPLYLYSAGAVVLVSFIGVTLLFRNPTASGQITIDVTHLPGVDFSCKVMTLGSRWLSISLLLLILICGFFGSQDTFENLVPTMVWVNLWVGLVFVSVCLGNVWSYINPWYHVFALTSSISARNTGLQAKNNDASDHWDWHPVLLFSLFAWSELIWTGAEKPKMIATMVLVYSLYLALGVRVNGLEWLQKGDIFTRIYTLFARLSVIHFTHNGIQLRLPGKALVTHSAMSAADIAFVFVLLSFVSFDGILETPWWQELVMSISQSAGLRPALLTLQSYGINLLMLIKTLAFLLTPWLLFSVFMLFCKLSIIAGKKPMALMTCAGHYTLALVPIALAYHIAHYLSYLLIAGQQVIPLASDPLGFGWNLFDTRHYRIDVSVINTQTLWHIAIAAVVAGHVISVVLAHLQAVSLYSNKTARITSQLPILVLMIAYTMLSLWILSQPLVQ